jgi:hypothetical protein
METTILHQSAASTPDVVRSTRPSPTGDRNFFLIAACLAIVLIAVGFGRGFVPGVAHPRPRPPIVMIHAAVFASWIILFAVQVSLIETGRRRLHKKLGRGGVGLAIAMLILGFATALNAARTGYAPVPGMDALAFLVIPLGDLVVFAPLVGAALYWRQRPDVHKRLMWLATASLTFPAVTRLPYVQGKPLLLFPVFLAVMLFGPVYERLVFGKVHRVMLWGGVGVFATVLLRGAIGRTVAWHHLAAYLIR